MSFWVARRRDSVSLEARRSIRWVWFVRRREALVKGVLDRLDFMVDFIFI